MALSGIQDIPDPGSDKNWLTDWRNWKKIKASAVTNTMLDYGADGTGVLDSTTVLQYLITNGISIYDDGHQTYKITSTVSAPFGVPITISGRLRLRPNGDFTCLKNVHTDTQGFSALTGTALFGAHSGAITVADITGFAVGQILLIYANTSDFATYPLALWPYGTSSNYIKGETKKIESISGSVITPSVAMFISYPSASFPVRVVSFAPAVVNIDGLEIIYASGVSTDPNVYGLELIRLDGASSKMNNVTVKGAAGGGLYMANCIGFMPTNCNMIENFVNGYGYGILAEKCSDCHVLGIYAYRNRHGVDFSGGYPSHFCSVQNSTIIGRRNDPTPQGSCLGSHASANHIYYIGNKLSSSPIGIQSRSPNTFVYDNLYWDLPTFVVHFAPGLSVKGNVLRNQSISADVPDTSLNNYFIEIDYFDGTEDTILYPYQTSFVIEDNDVGVSGAFLHFRSGITKMEYFSIRNNNVDIFGGTVSFIEAISAMTIRDTSCIGPNNVNAFFGTYVEWRNITVLSTATGFTGATRQSVGNLHFYNGTAGAVTASTDADDLVFEGKGNTGFSFLAPATKTVTQYFGKFGNATATYFQYDGVTDLKIGTGITSGTVRLYAGSGTEVINFTDSLITFDKNVAAFTASGLITAAAGVTFTGGTAAAGTIVKDSTYGLTSGAVAGSTADYAIIGVSGNVILQNPASTDTWLMRSLIGTGTRLVTSTATGIFGNATTIAGDYAFSGTMTFGTYTGQTSIVTLGTITTGTWQGTSIATTYTDAKIKTVTGTSNRLTIGGTATDPTFDISTAYVGQATITTLGTITTGVWTGTTIAVANGGTGVTSSTGSTSVVLSASPTLSGTIGGNLTWSGTQRFNSYVGIGNAGSTDVGLSVYSAPTTATQYGVLVQATFANAGSAMTNAYTFYGQLTTGAAAFTLTNGYGLFIDSPSKGAGSTITNAYGLRIANQTAGGTSNYAIFTGSGTVLFGDLAGTGNRLVQASSTGLLSATLSAPTVFLRSLFNSTTQTGNTAITETDLFSFTVAAATLTVNGDSIEGKAAGTFATSINSKQIKVYFGANPAIFDSGSVAITTAASWVLEFQITRTGATTQKCNVSLTTSSGTLSAYANYTTGAETLSSSSVFRITGTATGASDIIGEMCKGIFVPAP